MSQLSNNIDDMDNILTDLPEEYDKMYKVQRSPPPAVPPKTKAQPQVPRSAVVNTLREPSYSSRISPAVINNNAPTYGNMPGNIRSVHKDYANMSISPNQNSKSLQSLTSLSSRPLPLQPSANQNSRPLPLQPSANQKSRPLPLHPSSTQTLRALPKQPVANQSSRPLPLQPKNIYNTTYSNLPPYNMKDEDLPLPPPPSNLLQAKYETNQNHDEYLPPPSPVSSNYSELVRATANLNFNEGKTKYPPIYQNEYPAYGASLASTYESLYEPINPRPHSNFSAQTSASIQSYCHNPPNIAKPSTPKEEEVDVLTDLLVKSISDSQDLDTFGTCVRCNEKVVGETSGCTAMGKVYHVKCFTCQHCRINLQGKPFYAVEGQPYCETDYYETLEKCSVCDMPILDRILRATGKPYHPSCFACVMCGKSLDGIPFTVDAMNQIHCIEDFHKKFAPRCCVCELPIMPEEGEEETVRVVALDRSFHVRCYRCEDCGLLLSSEAEGRGCYPLDDHILCKNCNAHRVRLLTNVMTTDL